MEGNITTSMCVTFFMNSPLQVSLNNIITTRVWISIFKRPPSLPYCHLFSRLNAMDFLLIHDKQRLKHHIYTWAFPLPVCWKHILHKTHVSVEIQMSTYAFPPCPLCMRAASYHTMQMVSEFNSSIHCLTLQKNNSKVNYLVHNEFLLCDKYSFLFVRVDISSSYRTISSNSMEHDVVVTLGSHNNSLLVVKWQPWSGFSCISCPSISLET